MHYQSAYPRRSGYRHEHNSVKHIMEHSISPRCTVYNIFFLFPVSFSLAEDNQRACMSVLPLVKVWLQQVSGVRVELAQPICSFINMTVANNCERRG